MPAKYAAHGLDNLYPGKDIPNTYLPPIFQILWNWFRAMCRKQENHYENTQTNIRLLHFIFLTILPSIQTY